MLLRSVSTQTSYLGLKHIRASYPVYVFTWLFHGCLRFNRSQTEFSVSTLLLFCFVSSVASPSHQSNKPETWTILPLNYFLKPSMYFLLSHCLCPNSVSSYLAWCQDKFLTSKYNHFISLLCVKSNLLTIICKVLLIQSHLYFLLHLLRSLIPSHCKLLASL